MRGKIQSINNTPILCNGLIVSLPDTTAVSLLSLSTDNYIHWKNNFNLNKKKKMRIILKRI